MKLGWIYCNPAPVKITEVSFDVTLGNDFWRLMDNIDSVRPTDPAIWYYQYLWTCGQMWIPPGKMYIGSTAEYCGSTVPFITTSMRTKSTFRRWGLDVAMAAGMGEPGFHSRWALELHNSHNVPVMVETGWPVAQLLFSWCMGATKYNRPYNAPESEWTADVLLPKSMG